MMHASALTDSRDCVTVGCPNEADTGSTLCSYCRRQTNKEEAPVPKSLPTICRVEGCDNQAPALGRYAGYCAKHRARGVRAETRGDTVTPASQAEKKRALAVVPEPERETATIKLPAKQRIYLAGPMRHVPLFNFPAFKAAAAYLREQGYEVWSPAEADEQLDDFDPEVDEARPFVHYMRRDLPAVMDSDMVVVLPGWQNSNGARLEVHVATKCGIPVLRYPDLSPARHPSSQAFHAKLELLGSTHDAKNADYGTDLDSLANIRACEQLGIPAFTGVEVRIGDKTARVASFMAKGSLVNESVADSVLDRAVYSVIQLVLLDETASGAA